MNKIEAILFDMGGVLISFDRKACIKNFHKLGYYKMEEQMDACHPTGLVSSMEHGDITADQFCDAIIAESNPGTTREEVANALMSFCSSFPVYKMELIKELRKKYKVYILSNSNPIVMDGVSKWLAAQGMSFEKDFDGCFFSCEMKLQKPSPEAFNHVINSIDLPAGKILFIDDSIHNCEAGAACGLTTLHYIQESDLRAAVLQRLTELQ